MTQKRKTWLVTSFWMKVQCQSRFTHAPKIFQYYFNTAVAGLLLHRVKIGSYFRSNQLKRRQESDKTVNHRTNKKKKLHFLDL